MAKTPCGRPVALPVKEHSIAGVDEPKHGVKMSIGTPPQDIVFQLHADWPVVATARAPIDETNCQKDRTADMCVWMKGGIFDKKKSSSWTDETNESYGGTVDHGAEGYGTDWLRFGGDFDDQPKFPIVIDNGQNSNYVWNHQTIVGLNEGSNLVHRLYLMKSIPSKLFSLDYGKNGNNKGEGELLFGGYNKKRVEGDFKQVMKEYSFTDERCNYQVDVVKITAKFKDGSSVTMLDGRMRSCIKPVYPMLTLPNSVFEKLNEKMGRPYDTSNNSNRARGELYHQGWTADKDKNFDGELEYELASGQKITIPNDQLIADYHNVVDGKRVSVDSNKSVVMLENLKGTSANDMPLLGAPFLASVYWTVDIDRRKFFLGPAAHPEPGDNDYTIVPGAKVLECDGESDGEDSSDGTSPPPSSSKSFSSKNGSPTPSNSDSDEDDSETRTSSGASPSKTRESSIIESSGPDGSGGTRSGGNSGWNTDGKTSGDINYIYPPANSNNNGNGAAAANESPNSVGGGDSKTNMGAIVGGAVGGSVAAILIVALLFLLLRQRKKTKAHSLRASDFSGMTKFPETPGPQDSRSAPVSGYYDKPPLTELPHHNGTHEMATPRQAHELPPMAVYPYAHNQHGEQSPRSVYEADSREIYNGAPKEFRYTQSSQAPMSAVTYSEPPVNLNRSLRPSPPQEPVVSAPTSTRTSQVTRKAVPSLDSSVSSASPRSVAHAR